MEFPGKFREKMLQLLGEKFEAFENSYDKPRRRGLRVNVSKITTDEFLRMSPFPLERIPWVKNGFFYSGDVRPARHPYYAAGLFYLQEPSAMTPASRLPLQAGDKVLDLCAAPGGKATELAARLTVLDREAAEQMPQSLLVTNDISQQRAKALLHNLEMTGTENYCVLNETPERLAGAFPQFFDKILVDAPCSGEGMFRKEEEALRLWSPDRVADFARQQKDILKQAYAMLKPGGMLLYSTCTFSPEENEQQIADFLRDHPDMLLQEIEPYEGFSEGRPDWVVIKQMPEDEDGPEADRIAEELRKCVRIWPHKIDGEGHFLALMKKEDPRNDTADKEGLRNDAVGSAGLIKYSEDKEGSHTDVRKKKQKKETKKRDTAGRPNREQLQLLREFLCDTVGSTVAEKTCSCIEVRQDKAFLPLPIREHLAGLHVMRGGTYIGEWKKSRFEPAQAWAMTQRTAKDPETKTAEDRENGNDPAGAARKEFAGRKVSLRIDDVRTARYLAGESFPAENMPDGWALVCVEGFSIGWCKIVRGVAKNHYPAAWRTR